MGGGSIAGFRGNHKGENQFAPACSPEAHTECLIQQPNDRKIQQNVGGQSLARDMLVGRSSNKELRSSLEM